MKYFMLSLLAACADLVSKKAVRDNIPRGRKVHIKGRLYLWHIKNKGLAYNKLEDKRKTVVTASASAVGLVAAYLVYLIKTGAKPVDKIGAALILGGGIGNFAERIKDGEVTDFIYVEAKKMPIFNIADIIAAAGGIITVVRAFFR